MATGDGQEVLVLDGDEKVQKGLAQLLSSQGLVPTVVSDPDRARALLKEKYFPVALVDLDTPQPNDGLQLVRWVKQDANADAETALLVVEPPEDAWLGEQLKTALAKKGGYTLRAAGSGGEALDVASAIRFQLALVCQTLPDLPGSMVVNTLRAQSPDT